MVCSEVKKMELLIAYIDTSVFGAIYDIEDAYRVDVTKNLIDILKDRKGFEPAGTWQMLRKREK